MSVNEGGSSDGGWFDADETRSTMTTATLGSAYSETWRSLLQGRKALRERRSPLSKLQQTRSNGLAGCGRPSRTRFSSLARPISDSNDVDPTEASRQLLEEFRIRKLAMQNKLAREQQIPHVSPDFDEFDDILGPDDPVSTQIPIDESPEPEPALSPKILAVTVKRQPTEETEEKQNPNEARPEGGESVEQIVSERQSTQTVGTQTDRVEVVEAASQTEALEGVRAHEAERGRVRRLASKFESLSQQSNSRSDGVAESEAKAEELGTLEAEKEDFGSSEDLEEVVKLRQDIEKASLEATEVTKELKEFNENLRRASTKDFEEEETEGED